MRERKTGEAGVSFIEESVQVACLSLIYASRIFGSRRICRRIDVVLLFQGPGLFVASLT
jgi:hypothetical protein